MLPDKLAYMANQIGKFFAHKGDDGAVAGIADHMRKFWSPAMRRDAVAALNDSNANFDPTARRAVESLRETEQQS